MAQGTTARKPVGQQTVYRTAELNFNESGLAKSLGFVPAGTYIVRAGVCVTTPFNAGTSNLATIGWTGDPDDLAAALDVTTAGVKTNNTILTANDFHNDSSDFEVVATYTATGVAPTTGRGIAWIEYIVLAFEEL